MQAVNAGHFISPLMSAPVGPSLIAGLTLFTPTTSIDPMEVFVGQTAPPLAIVLIENAGILFGATTHSYFCRLVNADTEVLVRDAAATFDTDDVGNPRLTFALLATDFAVPGNFEYQFRAEDAGSGGPIYFDRMRLRVRERL